MHTSDGDCFTEAYHRLHRFGPELGGDEEGNHGMTNHGPMVVEVMVRRGLDVDVDRWLDRYIPRLDELPTPSTPIAGDWRAALGSASRLPDWKLFLQNESRDRPWPAVLQEWWTRLLPGVVAGSTHGGNRVGHAVRALRTFSGELPKEALDELAHGLAFWAARYRQLGSVAPAGGLAPEAALRSVVRLHDQSGLIAHRLTRLTQMPTWPASLRAIRSPSSVEDVPRQLGSLSEAAIAMYLEVGQAAPVLLVHAATAPNAIRHVLLLLPPEQWTASFEAAWAAAAAVVATYAPLDGVECATKITSPPTASEVLSRSRSWRRTRAEVRRHCCRSLRPQRRPSVAGGRRARTPPHLSPVAFARSFKHHSSLVHEIERNPTMGRIISNFFISLDGVVEKPETWHMQYFNDEMGAIIGAGMETNKAFLMGRKLYDEWSAHWTQSTDDIAGYFNNIPKFVISSSLKNPTWSNTAVLDGDVEAVREAKAGVDGDIAMSGSATTVRWLLDNGLLDELRLLLHPLAVGEGQRLFDSGTSHKLDLSDHSVLTTGVVSLTYRSAT